MVPTEVIIVEGRKKRKEAGKSVAHQIDALRFGTEAVKSDFVALLASHTLQSARESVFTFSQLPALGFFTLFFFFLYFVIFKCESCWAQHQHL